MMYELLAHVYDALVKDDEATACWVELIKAHIRGTELLELACGSGEITIALAQEGYHVAASDLSAAMIEEARRSAAVSRCHGASWTCVICIRIKAMTVSFVCATASIIC
ncbi:MAG: methyltransferase domain-containing protein [[Clostridium] innocuum]